MDGEQGNRREEEGCRREMDVRRGGILEVYEILYIYIYKYLINISNRQSIWQL